MFKTSLVNTPLIDTTAITNGTAKFFLIAAVATVVAGVITAIVFNKKRKPNHFSASVFLTFSLGLALLFVSMIVSVNNLDKSEKTSNTKISQYIQDKYGVTVLDDQAIKTDISENTTLTEVAIPAKDTTGKRIQITVELVDNGTDVLAFSSGAEMKKINQEN